MAALLAEGSCAAGPNRMAAVKNIKKTPQIVGGKKAVVVAAKEQKIDECRARRAALLEQKKQRVRDLRNKKQVALVPQAAFAVESTVETETHVAVPQADSAVESTVVTETHVAVPQAASAVESTVETETHVAEPVQGPKPAADHVAGPVQGPKASTFHLGFTAARVLFGSVVLIRLLSRGAFGSVYMGLCQSGQLVAVKAIDKTKISPRFAVMIRREVDIMAAFKSNKNIASFYGVFENDDHVFIAMELIEGGDMLQEINMRGGVVSEVEAKDWIRQVLAAIETLHGKRIAHRDLKPANIMLDKSGEVKLIDFGLSEIVAPGEKLSEMVGTPGYVAPEVFDGEGGIESDMFSIGVMCHQLLTGDFPFSDGRDSDFFSWKPDPVNAGPDFNNEAIWAGISYEARDFLRRLLVADPALRMTAAQARRHAWFTASQPSSPPTATASLFDREALDLQSCFF